MHLSVPFWIAKAVAFAASDKASVRESGRMSSSLGAFGAAAGGGVEAEGSASASEAAKTGMIAVVLTFLRRIALTVCDLDAHVGANVCLGSNRAVSFMEGPLAIAPQCILLKFSISND